jgi:hypothetical protein
MANYNLYTIRLCCAKVINSTRRYLGGRSRLPENPNAIPLKIIRFSLKAESSCNMACLLTLSKGGYALAPLLRSLFFRLL